MSHRQTDKAPFLQKVPSILSRLSSDSRKLAGCLVETANGSFEVIEDLVAGILSVSAYDQLTQLYLKVGHQKALGSARQALLIEPQMLPRHLQVIDLLFKQKDYFWARSQRWGAHALSAGWAAHILPWRCSQPDQAA
jgi:hypothetical protein